jgi:hypothetical protein
MDTKSITESSDPTRLLVRYFTSRKREDRVAYASQQLTPIDGDTEQSRGSATLAEMTNQRGDFAQALLGVGGMNVKTTISRGAKSDS